MDPYYKEPMSRSSPYHASTLRDPLDRFGSPAPQNRNFAESAYDLPTRNEFPPTYSNRPSDPFIEPGYRHETQDLPPRPVPLGSRRGGWHPRNWTRRTWFIAGIVAIIALIAIIVGAVVGTKANAYPDYTPLNYALKDTYDGENFFTNFHYWDTYDPAQGFVHYSNPIQSHEMNLTFASSTSAVLRVDNTEENAITGRHSARISSQKTYSSGLFIFDVLHTPYGCATWPAVWLTDQYNWPNNGEIDIIEATNKATTGNEMTLHTTDGCSMSVKREMTGRVLATDCYNGTNANQGCGVRGAVDTYGSTLNSAGGGVYATELRSDGIRIWFFPRAGIPEDISSGKPTPSTWGEALADFPKTHCDIGSHFGNLSIVANIDVCGSWAGAPDVYGASGCPSNCTDFAAKNPTAFDEAYWEFKSFKVYEAT